MRVWIEQKPNKKNCGVIAVAVITGVTVEEAAKAIGKNGATTTKQLAKGLRKLGYKCPSRCKRITSQWIPLAIGQLHDPKRKSGWHWVVIDEGRIYDGVNGTPDGNVNWKPDWRITSYLPIKKIS